MSMAESDLFNELDKRDSFIDSHPGTARQL